jgi:3-hydroxyisobutyrate dehydrogenase
MTEQLRIGYVGLGQMGGAIAERLLQPGIELHVHDVSAAAMERFTAQGAIAHPHARSVADAAEIVFGCLPSPDVSRAVALGPDGIAQGKAVRIYADMSTIGTEAMTGIAAQLAGHGIDMLDAPVTGGPPMARKGLLTLLVSGSPATVERVRPLLEAMGRSVHVIGDRPGMAQVMKVVNNIIMATNMAVAGEALGLGAKAGLDAGMMLRVLGEGTGQSFAACQILQRAVSGAFDYGAALAIVAKDMKLGCREAEFLGVDMPLISLASGDWQAALEQFGGTPDFTRLLSLYEARVGAEIRQR